MKKLMKTVVASAVALVASGAFATLPSPTADFESIAEGTKTVSDLVTNDQDKYWFAITNSSQELSGDIGFVTNVASRGHVLTLDASAPLYRTVNKVEGDGFGDVVSGLTTETIGSDGIYLDTWVKFTVSSDVFKAGDLDADVDKLAITCYSEDESDKTNILVRAGYVGSSVTATNYFLNLPQNFNIDEWHRLTVRAIADVGSQSAPVGFAIYLNRTLLTYDTDVDPDVAPGNSAYVASLNAAVTQNLYNSEKQALLPSLIDSSYTDCGVLSAVGFKGTGSVDDIQFTTDPGFIDEGDTVTIAWDEGVATYTVVDSNSKTLVGSAAVSGAGSTNLTLDVGVTYLTVTATYATGYEAGTWTVNGQGASYDPSEDKFTVANGATLNIVPMLPLYEVNGVAYDNLEAAMTAAAGGTEFAPATLKLLAACQQGLAFTDGYVILDLNGFSIQGASTDDYTIGNAGATLFITNSGAEASIMLPADNPFAGGAVMTAAGFTTVQAGTFEGAVLTIADYDTSFPQDFQLVTGGKFFDDGYDPTDPESFFYLAACVASGHTYTKDGNYVVVGSEEPIVGTYTVTVTPTNNTTYAAVYTNDNTAVTFEKDVAAITVGYAIMITVTPDSNYEYAATPDGWTAGANGVITKVVDEPCTVEIPAPTAVVIGTYSVTVTPTNNTTYAVTGAASNVGDVYTVATGHSITITVTPDSNYEYASAPAGWTAGANGVITKVVDEPCTVEIPAPTAKSSYPSYIPEDAAMKAKYDTWAETYGADTGSAYEAAFLLNIAPDATDQTLEPASITMEGGKVVISANQTLTAVNGKVYVKVATTLAGLATAEWTEVTLDEGKVQVTPGSSDTAGFYKIKVDF